MNRIQHTQTTLSVEKIFSTSEFLDEGYDRPRWGEGGSFYTTLHSRPFTAKEHAAPVSSQDILLHNAGTGEVSILVAAEKLVPRGEIYPLGIDDYATSHDKGKLLIFTKAQKVWRYKTKGTYYALDISLDHVDGSQLHQLGSSLANPTQLMFATFSHGATMIAYVMDHNIYVEDLASKSIRQLTHDGSPEIINGTFDWVYEEEFHLRHGFRWGPEDDQISFWRVDQTHVKVVHLINNTDELYPKLNPIHYPKCGEANAIVDIGIIRINDPLLSFESEATSSNNPSWFNIPGMPGDEETYISGMEFIKCGPNRGKILIQRLNRIQNCLQFWLINTDAKGEFHYCNFFTDIDSCWVDSLSLSDYFWTKPGEEFLYLSDRDGWRRAYAVSLSSSTDCNSSSNTNSNCCNNGVGDITDTGVTIDQSVITELTPMSMDVESIVGYSAELHCIYYISTLPTDAMRRYLFCVNLHDPIGGSTRVTPIDKQYEGTNGYSLSSDAKYAVHTISSLHRPVVTSIVALPGHQTLTVLATNAELFRRYELIKDAPKIETFRVDISADDANTNLHPDMLLDAWCMFPPEFNSNLKQHYPVLFHVYGEPCAAIVRDQWQNRIGLWHRMLAQRGCIVISIDNRGTPAPRGHSFRKECVYRQIGQMASTDQAQAVRRLLKDRAYIDPHRVAVWGWSGGGSMTLNNLFRSPDLFTHGISVAPVPDMRLYDTIYQERYMDTPSQNSTGYHDGSPINFVHQMRSEQRLLLIHGTGDDNCHYQGLERLVNELVRLNKPFQMIAYPNRSHSISEGHNTTRHLFESMTLFLQDSGIICKATNRS